MEVRRCGGAPMVAHNLPVRPTDSKPVMRAGTQFCCATTLRTRASIRRASRPISTTEVRNLLASAPGVRIVDDIERNYFPMPDDASGQDDILVGRIRADMSDPSGRSIALFVAGDQLLKGAALNAVQIAELLLEDAPGHARAN